MNKWLCTLAAVMLLALMVWSVNDDSAAGCGIATSACPDSSEVVTAVELPAKAHAVVQTYPHFVAQLAPDNEAVQISSAWQNDASPRLPAIAGPIVVPPSDGSHLGDSGNTLRATPTPVHDVADLADGGFEVTATSGSVEVDWTTAHEAGVVSYLVDRRPQEAANYDLGVQIGYPQGEGVPYSVVDQPPGAGTFIYRLRATFNNGTEAILAEGAVTR